jgi:DNA-binding CsgD family transcriptional regulator
MAAEAGEEAERAARVRVRANNGQWAIIEAARLVPGHAIAVSIRAAGPSEVLDLVARAHALTRRERELVELAANGLSTRQIAARLFISTYTAKDHLKSVFEKMGIHSRRELLGDLVG